VPVTCAAVRRRPPPSAGDNAQGRRAQSVSSEATFALRLTRYQYRCRCRRRCNRRRRRRRHRSSSSTGSRRGRYRYEFADAARSTNMRLRKFQAEQRTACAFGVVDAEESVFVLMRESHHHWNQRQNARSEGVRRMSPHKRQRHSRHAPRRIVPGDSRDGLPCTQRRQGDGFSCWRPPVMMAWSCTSVPVPHHVAGHRRRRRTVAHEPRPSVRRECWHASRRDT
jgi:hypothetical protein